MTDHDEEHFIYKEWQSFATYKMKCHECDGYMSEEVIKADTDEYPSNYTERLQTYYERHKDDKNPFHPIASVDIYDEENYGRNQYIYQGKYSINRGRVLGKQAIKHHDMSIKEYRGFVIFVNSKSYSDKANLVDQVYDFREYMSCEMCYRKIRFDEQSIYLSWEWFSLYWYHGDCVDIYTVYKRLRQ